MKKIFIFIIGTLLLSGCMHQQQEKDFEHKHFDDMQQKNAQEASLTGEKISTIDLLQPSSPLQINEMDVEYSSGTIGFFAEPADDATAPGVVIIHERWGLNDHIKDMARILAMHGYKTLAVDLYKGKVATDMETARTLSSSLIQEEATRNLLAAEAFLRTKTDKVASLGRCLGGKQSLELSLASETLDATIIYYGRLTSDASTLQNINEPILGIFAENDSGIPPSVVQEFQQALAQVGKNKTDITIYSGVNHAFANPTGNAFAKDATLDAWQKTLTFLEANLQ